MTTRTHLAAAVRWLNDLAEVTAGKASLGEIKPRLAGIASLLCDQFPEPAFSRDSLKACAAKLTFFPSYAELRDLLSPWWQEQDRTAITFDPDGLSDEDMACVRNWQRHANNNWGKQIPNRVDVALRNELARWRRNRERVFQHLVATDERARFMAQRAGWMPNKRAASDIPSEVRRGPVMDDEP